MRPGSRLLITTNAGESWQVVDQFEEEICYRDLTYSNQNTLFAGGDGGCMYKSVNRRIDWHKVQSGFRGQCSLPESISFNSRSRTR